MSTFNWANAFLGAGIGAGICSLVALLVYLCMLIEDTFGEGASILFVVAIVCVGAGALAGGFIQ